VAEAKKKKRTPNEVEFDFIKSNFFRVVHADGAFGGISPNGLIHMALYSERAALPTKIVQEIDESGQLRPEDTSRRITRKAIVREIEVDIAMDINTATALRKWLDEKIEMHASLTSGQSQKDDK